VLYEVPAPEHFITSSSKEKNKDYDHHHLEEEDGDGFGKGASSLSPVPIAPAATTATATKAPMGHIDPIEESVEAGGAGADDVTFSTSHDERTERIIFPCKLSPLLDYDETVICNAFCNKDFTSCSMKPRDSWRYYEQPTGQDDNDEDQREFQLFRDLSDCYEQFVRGVQAVANFIMNTILTVTFTVMLVGEPKKQAQPPQQAHEPPTYSILAPRPAPLDQRPLSTQRFSVKSGAFLERPTTASGAFGRSCSRVVLSPSAGLFRATKKRSVYLESSLRKPEDRKKGCSVTISNFHTRTYQLSDEERWDKKEAWNVIQANVYSNSGHHQS
jgi:hypothetical protein